MLKSDSPPKGYLEVQAAFSAFQSSLHIAKQYFPRLAPAAAQPTGSFFHNARQAPP